VSHSMPPSANLSRAFESGTVSLGFRHVPCDERLEIQILSDATRPENFHIFAQVFLAQPDMQAAVA